jgi:hypothetical protein
MPTEQQCQEQQRRLKPLSNLKADAHGLHLDHRRNTLKDFRRSLLNPAQPVDEVPYPSARMSTHPDNLATAAILLTNPAPLTHCRVLELGWQAAANHPHGLEHAGSEFIASMPRPYRLPGQQPYFCGRVQRHARHLDVLNVTATWVGAITSSCTASFMITLPVRDKILDPARA